MEGTTITVKIVGRPGAADGLLTQRYSLWLYNLGPAFRCTGSQAIFEDETVGTEDYAIGAVAKLYEWYECHSPQVPDWARRLLEANSC